MKTLQELAALLGGAVTREPGLEIHGVNGLDDAREGDITFVANPKYASKLAATRASAVIASPEVAKGARIPAISVANPDMAFLTAARCFAPPEIPPKPGIHATAVVGAGATIAKTATIGPLCVVGDGAVIGEGAVLDAQVYVGPEARIGAGTRLYPQVSVRERCVIGDRVILHCGVVIGSDGFGYVPINGVHVKIPQRGTVVIEDDVEIGANTTVDRARIDKTWIRKGVKIDNLCQIAHNVVIGEGSLLIAQVGVSGSTQLGKYVVLAGQVGVIGHLQVPDGVRVGAQSGLGHNPEPGQAVSGSPARPHLQNQREQVAISRLPELLKEVSDLRKRVEELEGKR